MPAKLSQKQVIIILGVMVFLVAAYFAVTSNLRRDSRPPEVKLTVWGFTDERSAVQGMIDAYTGANQNVQVSYTRIPEASYRDTLLNALAAGTGPDVFQISNRALGREVTKLVPVAESQFTLAKLRELFPSVVEQDFVRDGRVYALPLYLDTLALLYNTNAFDQAAIAAPPRTWEEFQQVIPHLRVLNANGQIVKAAAAIGGTERTVKNAADTLAVLMMQNGTVMPTAQGGRAQFTSGNRAAGLTAFNFYLQFANAASGVYTWNENQPYSMDDVGSGRTAMMLGYASDLAALKKKNPLVALGIAPLPQIALGTPEANAVNYPSYAGFAVSKQAKNPEWAWHFVISTATNSAEIGSYLSSTRRPPALRSLIAANLADPALGVFARQALTARSWADPDEVASRQILSSAIGDTLSGRLTASRGLKQAEDQINQLISALSR